MVNGVIRCSFCGSDNYNKIIKSDVNEDKYICDKCARLCKQYIKSNVISFS